MGIEINRLLQFVVDRNASDLHLCVGRPPTVRLHGRLLKLDTAPLTPEDTLNFMKAITPDRHQQELQEVGTSDFGFAFADQARFRVSVYHQKGHHGVALRLIPNKLLSFEEIGLPHHIKEMLTRPRGLVLVTGPTGCGKTTTQATMVDFINENTDRHIITIEDPIEYYHEHKKSIITQREIGVDVPSFKEGVRRALRQDPDVILVGEMRDLETIGAAISAAETGHIVFATLHTTGSARTVNRIIDAFPTTQQGMVRSQLAVSILAVISQELLPRVGGQGRVAAFEIMVLTDAISNLIRENKVERIDSEIQTGRSRGMILLDDFLFYELFAKGIIDYKTMMTSAQRPDELQRKYKERSQ
ncbi:MAG TPA: type IV pilus twitching motility protein PilT [Planctomycetota bacterium]|nr:type IV pilus twitching motility protein PilT [Planctomycetota bacterium]